MLTWRDQKRVPAADHRPDRSLRFKIVEPASEEWRRDPRFDRVRQRLGIER
jgi:hypothetical protein